MQTSHIACIRIWTLQNLLIFCSSALLATFLQTALLCSTVQLLSPITCTAPARHVIAAAAAAAHDSPACVVVMLPTSLHELLLLKHS